MDLTGIGAAATAISSVVNKFLPDKTQAEKDQAAQMLAELQGQITLATAQSATDTAEASNASLWVSGWRPGVGWACGAAFGWSYVLAPMLTFFAHLAGSTVALPALDISGMMPVLLGMLGLGGMRSIEKVKGVTTHA